MRLSGTSFTGGWSSRFEFTPRVRLTTSARLGWLGLGASDDFFVDETGRRSYNMATGVTAAADVSVGTKRFEYVSLIWRHYNLFNLNVIGSRPGRETWDILEGQIEIPVWSRFRHQLRGRVLLAAVRLQELHRGQPEPYRGPRLGHVAVLERRSVMKNRKNRGQTGIYGSGARDGPGPDAPYSPGR